MFRKILVPLDGSAFAEHALPYAVHAARLRDADIELALVHVRHSPVATDRSMREALEAWEAAHVSREKQYLDELVQRLTDEDGLRVHARLLHGEVVPALEREVRDASVDLVVMTTHGRAGLERAWLGSVADSLLRGLDAPVLLIRPLDDHPREEMVRYEHILVALDGSERAERALEPAMALSNGAGSHVTLLRVVQPPSALTSPYLPQAARVSHEELQERQEDAAVYLADVAARLHTHGADLEPVAILGYHPARSILDHACRHGVDLIAVSTHGRGSVARLLMGSVTDKVVRAAGVPVLVC